MPDPIAHADVPDDHADKALDEISRTCRGCRIAGFIALVVVTAVFTVLVVGRTGGHKAGTAPLDRSTISGNIAGHYRYAAAHAEHPGTDGDHLFRIAVPVDGSSTPLVLSVAEYFG